MRTGVSDETRLNLIFDVLTELGWDYVQMVYANSEYGYSMRNKFKLLAQKVGICMADEHEIPPDGEDAGPLVQALNPSSSAPVVVLFAEMEESTSLLVAINKTATARFTFLAPKWNRQSLTRHIPKVIDVMVFDVSPAQNTAFNQYLIRQSADKGTDNLWAREFVESNFDCRFRAGDSVISGAQNRNCDQKAVFGQIPNFRPSEEANHVINSVYALAFGLHKVLENNCGKGFDGICSSFRTLDLKTRNRALIRAVGAVKFRDESNRNFAFTSAGDGAIPLTIYSLRRSRGVDLPTYVQVRQ